MAPTKKMPKKTGEKKVKRKPSAYNVFMKSEYAKVKKQYPDKKRTEIFAMAAQNWHTSKANPKNK